MEAFFIIAQVITWVILAISYWRLKIRISAYDRKKGENLATKEDIAELTKIPERIKAKMSHVNAVHKVQFETEFEWYKELWRSARAAGIGFIKYEYLKDDAANAEALRMVDVLENQMIDAEPFVFEDVIASFGEMHDALSNFGAGKTSDDISKAATTCIHAIKKRLSEMLVID